MDIVLEKYITNQVCESTMLFKLNNTLLYYKFTREKVHYNTSLIITTLYSNKTEINLFLNQLFKIVKLNHVLKRKANKNYNKLIRKLFFPKKCITKLLNEKSIVTIKSILINTIVHYNIIINIQFTTKDDTVHKSILFKLFYRYIFEFVSIKINAIEHIDDVYAEYELYKKNIFKLISDEILFHTPTYAMKQGGYLYQIYRLKHYENLNSIPPDTYQFIKKPNKKTLLSFKSKMYKFFI